MTSGEDKSLIRYWEKSGFSDKHHTGLSVYDPESNKVLFSYRADNYFTPASNTKIMTLYAALQTLGDSITAARYFETEDSLYVWGGGDPGTYFPLSDTISLLVDFLSQSKKPIVFSTDHFKARRFGRGWAWDDYPFTFQCERNAFPAYGNRVWIERHGDQIIIKPNYLGAAINIDTGSTQSLRKSEWGDLYEYTYNSKSETENLQLPITFFENDTRYTWGEMTGQNINYTKAPLLENTKAIMGSSRDTLLKIMMHDSDNFVAEQLLLNCSLEKLNYLADVDFIKRFKAEYLFNLPQEAKWYDGSGLSRYNAITPASLVDVLHRIYLLKGISYIKTIFPAGGESGTIKSYLIGPEGRPYVYAKSGTLKDVFCLSGYMITPSGKVLLFSWMNNNIEGSTDAIKSDMEKYLLFMYQHYRKI